MNLIHTGAGPVGEVIAALIIVFLALLTAFITLIVIIACRYHASRHTGPPAPRHPRNRATDTVKPRSRQFQGSSAGHR